MCTSVNRDFTMRRRSRDGNSCAESRGGLDRRIDGSMTVSAEDVACDSRTSQPRIHWGVGAAALPPRPVNPRRRHTDLKINPAGSNGLGCGNANTWDVSRISFVRSHRPTRYARRNVRASLEFSSWIARLAIRAGPPLIFCPRNSSSLARDTRKYLRSVI